MHRVLVLWCVFAVSCYCQLLSRGIDNDRIFSLAQTSLAAPSTLGHLLSAALLLSNVSKTQLKCNCRDLKAVLRESENSLDIYYGLRVAEVCNCNPPKINDRLSNIIMRDAEVSIVFFSIFC